VSDVSDAYVSVDQETGTYVLTTESCSDGCRHMGEPCPAWRLWRQHSLAAVSEGMCPNHAGVRLVVRPGTTHPSCMRCKRYWWIVRGSGSGPPVLSWAVWEEVIEDWFANQR
jgi:hypothetical protein